MVTVKGLIKKASGGDRWQLSRKGNGDFWYQKKKTQIKALNSTLPLKKNKLFAVY